MQAFLKGDATVTREKQASKPSSSAKTTSKLTPWVEKYRPKSVNDVAYQEEVIAVLKKSLTGADLPNLLFYGPPGTGKTSTILAAARQLFGNEMYRQRVLELNASDERGIDVIRHKVKDFSQQTAFATRPDGKPCPPFKIVILDEADSMTTDAQSALRRTMEKQSRTTRFCLICNYVSRIIEPITSRCAKFRFKPLAGAILIRRLREIAETEAVKCSEQALEMLVEISEGDMRKAITTLQSASRYKSQDEELTREDVINMAGVVPDSVIDDLLETCYNGSYKGLQTAVDDVMADGFSASQILVQLHDKIVYSERIDDNNKSSICEKLAIADKCLMDGASEYLQLMDFLSHIIKSLVTKLSD